MSNLRPSGSSSTYGSLTAIRDVAILLERQFVHEMCAYVDNFRDHDDLLDDLPATEGTSKVEDPDKDRDEDDG